MLATRKMRKEEERAALDDPSALTAREEGFKRRSYDIVPALLLTLLQTMAGGMGVASKVPQI